jgi:hypothetical protein
MQKALIIFLCFLIGCGSSGSSSNESDPVFSGTWLLAYNIIIDECGLVEGDATAFDDTQEVAQKGKAIEVNSDVLLGAPYTGSTRSSDSFLAKTLEEGDLFGDGIFCQLIEDLAYNDLDGDSATSMYKIRIKCADGFVCDSAVRGTAERAG